MFDWLKTLFDRDFGQQHRLMDAVTAYMRRHYEILAAKVFAQYFAERAIARDLPGKDEAPPDVVIDITYADFGALVMFSTLDKGGQEDLDPAVQAGWAAMMLSRVLRIEFDQALVLAKTSIENLPQIDPAEGQSFEDYFASLDEPEQRRLMLLSLANKIAARIAEGVANRKRKLEPTDEEVEKVGALVSTGVE